ncbi:hypothetical protein [Oryzobacter terrae]|uniref:hypothetical protein n=1 Tax=Oryzobacter terrae TaxID=1620385 RepID=UPI00366C5CF7
MRALSLVGVGLLVVFLDLRIEGFDLIADPVGWGLVAAGASRLRERHPAGFDLARYAAVAAAVTSAVEAVLVLGSPGAGAWLSVVVTLLDLAVVVGLCTALAALLDAAGDRRSASARLIRAGDVALTVVMAPLLAWGAVAGLDGSMSSYEAAGAGLVFLGVLVVGVALRLWLVVLLFGVGPVVEPPEPSAPSPDPEAVTP